MIPPAKMEHNILNRNPFSPFKTPIVHINFASPARIADNLHRKNPIIKLQKIPAKASLTDTSLTQITQKKETPNDISWKLFFIFPYVTSCKIANPNKIARST